MVSAKCKRVAVGSRGSKVYLFERRPGGSISLRVGQGTARCLGHIDWARAKREGYEVLSLDQPLVRHEELTFAQITARYLRSGKAEQWTPAYVTEVRRVLSRFCDFFGPAAAVAHLTPDDISRYTAMRKQTCRMARIQKDLAILRASCRWARTERRPDRARLLSENPFEGLSLPREKNPRRPVLTEEDYGALCAGAAESFRETFTLFLNTLYATGKRFQQVARLRPEHLRPDGECILWVAESEKTRYERTTAVAPDLIERLLAHANAAWVFPAEQDAEAPLSYYTFKNWWRRTASRLNLNLPPGSGAHAIRRKWATERGTYDPATLQAAGGWRDRNSLTAYQQTDRGRIDFATLNPTMLVTRKGIVSRDLGTFLGTSGRSA